MTVTPAAVLATDLLLATVARAVAGKQTAEADHRPELGELGLPVADVERVEARAVLEVVLVVAQRAGETPLAEPDLLVPVVLGDARVVVSLLHRVGARDRS